MNVLRTCVIPLCLAAVPLFGQIEPTSEATPPPPAPARSLRSAVELHYYNFANFFQASGGLPERNVNGLGATYRATWSLGTAAPDLYGRLSALRYSGGASETSYTGTVGVSKYGSVHWYDVYVERTENGYAFEIDETRASANITAMNAHYSYGITREWRVGTNLYLDRTRFNVDTGSENDYRSLGFDVRYRGFGDLFQPRAGFVSGNRDSRDGTDSADERYWFVELRTEPREDLDFRLRYRDRTRDYENVSRVDDRKQWTLRGTFKQTQHLSWTGSYTTEDVDSSLPGRDFDRSTAYLGIIYGF